MMKKVLQTLIVGLGIASLGWCAADNTAGTWKRNIAKSKTTPAVANPITSLTITNKPIDGGVEISVSGERKDGTKISSNYTVKYDGKEYPVTGAPWDMIAMKQVDANTITIDARKTDGKYHMTGKTVVSKDGKTMTTTTKGTNAEGKPSTTKAVWDKQ